MTREWELALCTCNYYSVIIFHFSMHHNFR